MIIEHHPGLIDAAVLDGDPQINLLRSVQFFPMRTAPKDGTPILVTRGHRSWPIIVHFGHLYEGTTIGRAWVGADKSRYEENGAFGGWLPLPNEAGLPVWLAEAVVESLNAEVSA